MNSFQSLLYFLKFAGELSKRVRMILDPLFVTLYRAYWFNMKMTFSELLIIVLFLFFIDIQLELPAHRYPARLIMLSTQDTSYKNFIQKTYFFFMIKKQIPKAWKNIMLQNFWKNLSFKCLSTDKNGWETRKNLTLKEWSTKSIPGVKKYFSWAFFKDIPGISWKRVPSATCVH